MKILQLRQAKSLSQVRLAKAIGIGQPTLSRWEADPAQIPKGGPAYRLLKLLATGKVTIDALERLT